MNRQITQFWVAIIGMAGLVVACLLSIAGMIWAESPSELTFMLIGGLLSTTTMAATYLFRLNGTK